MTGGIIVARDGYRVETATVLQQVFNSGLNTLKVLTVGTLSSTASGTRTVTYNPGVNWQAGYMIWFQVSGNGRWYLAGVAEDFSGGSVEVTSSLGSDGGLDVEITSTGSYAVVVKYMLLVDPGA